MTVLAKAKWLLRWSRTKPVPTGYRRDFEPNKFVFLNGFVFEFPRESVDRQIHVEKLWLELEVTLQKIAEETGQTPITAIPSLQRLGEEQRKVDRYIC